MTLYIKLLKMCEKNKENDASWLFLAYPEILPFLPLTEEINPSLFDQPAVTFPGGDAKKDIVDIP